MPSSLLAQWSEHEPGILWMLRTAPRPAGRVLDVGPGHGKGAVLLREYVDSVLVVYACEAAPEYVQRFHLFSKYDGVLSCRFEELWAPDLDMFDTILMIDVIEHMSKPAALAAIERCRGQVVVCTPIVFEEAWEPGMPETEHHVSLWGMEDFEGLSHPIEYATPARGGLLVRLGPKGRG